MKTRLTKPTVFMSNEEVAEAVSCGYLDCDYGYSAKWGNKAPTIMWKIGKFTSHQSNEENIWSNSEYVKLLQQSVMWSDIQEYYAPKKVSFMQFLDDKGVTTQFLENCMTCNQRWSFSGSYYDALSQLKEKDPDAWLLKAFSWIPQTDDISWRSLNEEWQKVIRGKKVVWEKRSD